jgi:ribonuclease D
VTLITTTDALARACAEAAAAPFVTVDTEFMRESTFWPKLCLIQIAWEGGQVAIDPLASGLSLEPLFVLLRDEKVLKVFHAARQDLEIFHKLMGAFPTPLFDTQIAAMAAGFGEQVAYDALVQQMLRRQVDKSSRFTDWSRRPLTGAQVTYAIADVTHLRDLFPMLWDKLETAGRLEWVTGEMEDLVDPEAYDVSPENAWKRLRLRKTTQDYLAVLAAAAAWREQTAQERNVPRARIAKDDALYEIAEQKPRNLEAMDRLRALPRGFANSRHGQELLEMVQAALANPEAHAPKVERQRQQTAHTGAIVELLKVLLKLESDRAGVAPKLIATVSDLEAIAADDDADTAALKGWRREIFGQRALDLKAGRIALTLDRGRLIVAETALASAGA